MSNDDTPRFMIGNGPDGSAALLVTQPPEHTPRLVIEKSELYDDVWEAVVSAVEAINTANLFVEPAICEVINCNSTASTFIERPDGQEINVCIRCAEELLTRPGYKVSLYFDGSSISSRPDLDARY